MLQDEAPAIGSGQRLLVCQFRKKKVVLHSRRLHRDHQAGCLHGSCLTNKKANTTKGIEVRIMTNRPLKIGPLLRGRFIECWHARGGNEAWPAVYIHKYSDQDQQQDDHSDSDDNACGGSRSPLRTTFLDFGRFHCS
jgi:hypothetical protein